MLNVFIWIIQMRNPNGILPKCKFEKVNLSTTDYKVVGYGV